LLTVITFLIRFNLVFYNNYYANVDFLGRVDCVSAGVASGHRSFGNEDFRLHGDDGGEFSGAFVDVRVRLGEGGVSGDEDAFVRGVGGRRVVGGERVRGVDYAFGRE